MDGIVKYREFGMQNIRYMILLSFSIAICSLTLNAQADKKYIRQGNREYDKSKFSESEVLYRKAIDKNKETADAVFNIGDALYKQKKYEDAGKQFLENVSLNDDKKKKSAGLYNLGNSLLMSNKVKESIDAYKGSLKLDPKNFEAKYNLSYAQDLLKQQEEQQKKQENDKKDNQKDDQKKDQSGDNDKKQDDNSQNNKDQNEKNDKQQQKQQAISQEDAQRLLNALENDEKKVQEKVKLAKASKTKVMTVKNW
jgi:tetratricopeptide (TPR) repeat protein